jgi:hypothetical protein
MDQKDMLIAAVVILIILAIGGVWWVERGAFHNSAKEDEDSLF